MSAHTSPNLVSDGIVFSLDAGDPKSYAGSGTTWSDRSLDDNDVTLLNGPTWNSAGYFEFDGVDDYARPTIDHSYLNNSAMEIAFNSNSHSTRRFLFGYRHNNGYSWPTIGAMYINDSKILASVITTTEVYRHVYTPTNIATDEGYHVILNKNTVDGELELYVNGVLVKTTTFDADTYAQWSTVGNYIGNNQLDIAKSTNVISGQGWGSDYFSGKIYRLAVYDHVLTQQEVLQNYNALKSRFIR